MRLLALAVLIAATSLTACSGTATGTGDGRSSPGGAFGGRASTTVTDSPAEDGGTSTLPTPTTSSEYDVLFAELPGTPTPESIDGVWSGTMGLSEDDVRVKLTSSSMTVAVRCGSGNGSSLQTTIGLKISAVVTSNEIQILESKSVATPFCKITVTPQTFTSGSVSGFTLSGTSLEFPTTRLWRDTQHEVGPRPMLTKVSD